MYMWSTSSNKELVYNLAGLSKCTTTVFAIGLLPLSTVFSFTTCN